MEFADAIKDPRHERHGEFVEWHGEFDPEVFDPDAVNKELRRLRQRMNYFGGRRAVIENKSRSTEVEGGRVHNLIEEDERGPSTTRFRPEIASRQHQALVYGIMDVQQVGHVTADLWHENLGASDRTWLILTGISLPILSGQPRSEPAQCRAPDRREAGRTGRIVVLATRTVTQ